MKAITPSFAHACQTLCLMRRPYDIRRKRFRFLSAKAKYPNFPNKRTTTREKDKDFKGWAVFIDGRTHVSDGETTVRWGVVARSPDGRLCHVLARSLPQKRISRIQELDSAPTIPFGPKPIRTISGGFGIN